MHKETHTHKSFHRSKENPSADPTDITKRNKSVLDVCLSLNERPEMPLS